MPAHTLATSVRWRSESCLASAARLRLPSGDPLLLQLSSALAQCDHVRRQHPRWDLAALPGGGHPGGRFQCRSAGTRERVPAASRVVKDRFSVPNHHCRRPPPIRPRSWPPQKVESSVLDHSPGALASAVATPCTLHPPRGQRQEHQPSPVQEHASDPDLVVVSGGSSAAVVAAAAANRMKNTVLATELGAGSERVECLLGSCRVGTLPRPLDAAP